MQREMAGRQETAAMGSKPCFPASQFKVHRRFKIMASRGGVAKPLGEAKEYSKKVAWLAGNNNTCKKGCFAVIANGEVSFICQLIYQTGRLLPRRQSTASFSLPIPSVVRMIRRPDVRGARKQNSWLQTAC